MEQVSPVIVVDKFLFLSPNVKRGPRINPANSLEEQGLPI